MREVALTFELNEDVTPEIFARKIAVACARSGAIREGERVITWYSSDGSPHIFEYQYDKREDVLGNGKLWIIPHIEQVYP